MAHAHFRLASLERKQQELQKQSNTASKQISALVAADQKKFVSAIDQRLNNITSTLQRVLPAVADPGKSFRECQSFLCANDHAVPEKIKDVTDEHNEEYSEKRDTAAKENPMFDADDMM